jgi:hypothetical protein
MPQFRNIERFWAHLKRNVYSEGWTVGSVEQLIRKMKREIKKLPNAISKACYRVLKLKYELRSTTSHYQ